MKHATTLRIIAVASALAVSSMAQATAPLNTDDANAIAKGACEVETYGLGLRTQGVSINGLTARISCGVTESTKLGVGIGQARDDFGHANFISLTGKTTFIKGENGSASYALGYGITGAQLQNMGRRADSYYINGIVSKPLTDKITAHLNLGVLRDSFIGTDRTLGTWGLAGEYALTPTVALVAETYGQEGSKPWVAAGARWQASKAWSFGAALANQSGVANQFTLGAKYSF